MLENEIETLGGWDTDNELEFLRALAERCKKEPWTKRVLTGYIFSAKHFERRWGDVNGTECLATAERLLAELRTDTRPVGKSWREEW